MKSLVTLFIILTSAFYLPAQEKLKTENVILITFDGLRWQELFSGADSSLLNDKEYTKGKEELNKKYWDNNPEIRRKKLFPFFWGAISEKGQLMGNRNYDNKVDLTNKFWFSYPGYNELLTGFADPEVDSNDKKNNKNITILEYAHQQNKFNGKVAAFGSWDVFPYIINTQRSGIK
ncbi:MAG: phosphoglyceromutase, partial [Bacteroidota bacterium]|nr:phosphoglyceromutase [Bacteroidota bacterium]